MPKSDLWMLRIGLVSAFTSSLLFLLSPVTRLPHQIDLCVDGTVLSTVIMMFVLVRGAFPRLRGK